jgi:hypothetical protein
MLMSYTVVIMSDAKSQYCEIWLSTDKGKYRVSSRLPEDVKLPDGIICAKPEGKQERICVSIWYSTVSEARDRAISLSNHLRSNGHKVMFFFEIRLPLIGDIHTTN